MKKNKYAVVVLSHSSYADVWDVLSESYQRYFDSNKFDFFIATDKTENLKSNGFFNYLFYDKNLRWGAALQQVVKQLSYDKVIFSFDDLILTKKINEKSLIKELKESCQYSKLICSHVRIYERCFKKGRNFELCKEDSYRGSLVFAAVNQEFLDFILAAPISEFSPWQYEREINGLLPKEFRLKGVRYNIFLFSNLIIKGGINSVSNAYLKQVKCLEYQGYRKGMSFSLLSMYYAKLIVFTLVKYILPYNTFKLLRKLKQTVLREK